ncbi:MAG: hypothetical protein RLZZ528_2936 [Pseudomonadota bacterium]
MIRTLCLAASLALAPVAFARADDADLLRRAQILAEGKDWPEAVSLARQSGALAADIIDWQRLRDGVGTFAEYADFARRNPDWPGMPLLLKAGEAKAAEAGATEVIAYFAQLAPQTGTGSLALIASQVAAGQSQAAGEELVRAWRNLSLTAVEQEAFLSRYGDLLRDHHDGRMAAMLKAEQVEDARRMLPLVSPDTRAVAEARIALQTESDGVDALLSRVPASMAGSTGLAYDRFRWRIRKDRYDDAADLMLEKSGSAETLGDPARWSDWRRTLARREMREGDARKAYRMAASHHLTEGADFADLEWLAGYIALRKLGDAETGLQHFRRSRAAVSGPISTSRAAYWEGRALEVLGNADQARAAYDLAAQFQTAYYGQLAAERLGLSLDPRLTGQEALPDWNGAGFTATSVYRAAGLLQQSGNQLLATRFLLHLSESLSGDEIGRLAALAIEWNDANKALLLAKAAADKGVIWPRAYFPLMGMHKLDLPVPNWLALSITRRESEFRADAVSGAGARGLMQVMPGTAEMMSKKMGLGYSAGKLTSDPGYNVTLGSAYLAGLVEEFGPSPVLVAAGYNAGPGRSRQWIEKFGDPRSDSVDVVDWVEHIPFRETQTYVMRVSESLAIYRARISGQTEPVRITDELKGR